MNKCSLCKSITFNCRLSTNLNELTCSAFLFQICSYSGHWRHFSHSKNIPVDIRRMKKELKEDEKRIDKNWMESSLLWNRKVFSNWGAKKDAWHRILEWWSMITEWFKKKKQKRWMVMWLVHKKAIMSSAWTQMS